MEAVSIVYLIQQKKGSHGCGFLTYGVELTMLGLESQEHVHYARHIRVMGYDYGIYKKQYARPGITKYRKHWMPTNTCWG